jgi:hypothetical protein
MPRPTPNHVAIPIETEVLRLNRELFTGTRVDQNKGVIVCLDVRRRKWGHVIGMPAGCRVRWSRVHTVEIQELSSFLCPIRYEVTIGEPWWRDRDGTRHDFGVDEHLPGLDLKRGVTTVTLRAAVLMAVLACVGLRSVAWLMRELFHVEVWSVSHVPNRREHGFALGQHAEDVWGSLGQCASVLGASRETEDRTVDSIPSTLASEAGL